MKLIFTTTILFFAIILNAQTVVDFEEFNLPPNSFLNNADVSEGFISGDIILPNHFDPEFMSWSGWAISNTTDVTTPGYINQYTAIPGEGVNASSNYAVTYAYGNNNLILTGEAAGKHISGMYLTNSTYAYLSMLDGDAFSKKFGGLTGDDPDFFLLTIKAFNDGNLTADSVNFYLADFRFSDNSEDYIIDTWTWVDLSSLGEVDSLSFYLSSSDVGQFGMNTPAYFCLDNVFAEDPTVNSKSVNFDAQVQIFPNPAADFIQLVGPDMNAMDYTIFDTNGRIILHEKMNTKAEKISLRNFSTGTYLIKIQGENSYTTRVFVKK